MELFKNLGVNDQTAEAISKLGITEPTKIQEKSIPPVVQGKDVIAESATGSGKTIAFGCGIAQNISPGKGVQALVLTPTRELAEQVMKNLRELSRELRVTAVYGGVAIDPQMNHISRADVVVATPGRLLDHMERGTIDLSSVKLLVLDEADRMLDMGFIDDVEKIISQCPEQRQTLFFSATISQDIKNLSDRYMKEPVDVLATKMVDPAKLKQVYYDVPASIKLSLLAHLLRKEETRLAMVFCNTRRTTEFVDKALRSNGVKAMAIHGGMSQNKRQKMIDMFNKGQVNVLICTDVAARGLHINNVSHIYNYEVPQDPKDYVHRIGRTARAGEEGKVINLIAPRDHENFSRLLNEYNEFNVECMKKPYIERLVKVDSGSGPGGRNSGRPGGNNRQGGRRKGPGMGKPNRRW